MKALSILILSHGLLAKAFEDSLKDACNCKIDVSSFCLFDEDNLDEYENILEKKIEEKIKKEHSIILVTEMINGTPTNISLKLLKKFKDHINVISNINMQLLIYLNNNFKKYSNIKDLINNGIKNSESILLEINE